MKKPYAVLALLSCLLVATAAQAQTSRGGGNNANAQALQQMQQLASERTQLQAENAKLKKELEDLKKQVKTLETEKGALSARAQNSTAAITRATSQTQTLEQTITQQRAQLQELVAKFREMAMTLEGVETERTTLGATLATRDQELKACVEKNRELYKINTEILGRMEDRGFWSSLTSREPFTQITRTRLENLIDEYRDRAQDRRVPEPAAPTASPDVRQSSDSR